MRDLPNELALEVASALLPLDCLNLAMTCKQLATLLQPSLQKHKHLFAKYQTVYFYPNDRWKRSWLWDLTASIIREPSIATYVHELDLYNGAPMFYDNVHEIFTDEFNHLRPPKEQVDLITATANGLGMLDWKIPDSDETLRDDIARGEPTSVIAGLLYHLPELRSILYADYFDDCWIQYALRMIALSQTSAHPPKTLKKLEKAAVYRAGIHHGVDLAVAKSLLVIPERLRKFTGHTIADDEDFDPDTDDLWRHPWAESIRSRAENVHIDHSCIHHDKMLDMFKHVDGLKTFYYSHTIGRPGYATFLPRAIAKGLIECSKDTVEEITILNGNPELFDHWDEDDLEDPGAPSFASCHKLRYLRCDIAVFMDEPDPYDADDESNDITPVDARRIIQDAYIIPNDVDLTSLLPQSLVDLELDMDEIAPYAKLFMTLIKGRKRLPGLKRIKISLDLPLDKQNELWKLLVCELGQIHEIEVSVDILY